MNYQFYGWESATMHPIKEQYKEIQNPQQLYERLSQIWCADTCAPGLRAQWSKENLTLGQCSITAFLVQDIFGGQVHGILQPSGNYHCFNVIGDAVFDLTSEQFGEERLEYRNQPEQFREEHFANQEKKARYEYLKAQVEKQLGIHQ